MFIGQGQWVLQGECSGRTRVPRFVPALMACPDGSSQLGGRGQEPNRAQANLYKVLSRDNVGTIQLSLPTFPIFKLLSGSQMSILISNQKRAEAIFGWVWLTRMAVKEKLSTQPYSLQATNN